MPVRRFFLLTALSQNQLLPRRPQPNFPHKYQQCLAANTFTGFATRTSAARAKKENRLARKGERTVLNHNAQFLLLPRQFRSSSNHVPRNYLNLTSQKGKTWWFIKMGNDGAADARDWLFKNAPNSFPSPTPIGPRSETNVNLPVIPRAYTNGGPTAPQFPIEREHPALSRIADFPPNWQGCDRSVLRCS